MRILRHGHLEIEFGGSEVPFVNVEMLMLDISVYHGLEGFQVKQETGCPEQNDLFGLKPKSDVKSHFPYSNPSTL